MFLTHYKCHPNLLLWFTLLPSFLSGEKLPLIKNKCLYPQSYFLKCGLVNQKNIGILETQCVVIHIHKNPAWRAVWLFAVMLRWVGTFGLLLEDFDHTHPPGSYARFLLLPLKSVKTETSDWELRVQGMKRRSVHSKGPLGTVFKNRKERLVPLNSV